MDPIQIMFNVVLALAGAFGGFILKATWDALATLRKDLADLQASIAQNYVRRDDFAAHAERVIQLLDRIYERLDGKADKPKG